MSTSGLRATGAAPDPAFRAALRERLLAEAGAMAADRARPARRRDRLDRADPDRPAAPAADPGNSAR